MRARILYKSEFGEQWSNCSRLKRYVKWTEKHQGERRERHLDEQMPSVIYEVRPKQCHNSLKEEAGMKSKDDFLRGE